MMRYTLKQCRELMLQSVDVTHVVGIDWFSEIPRLTKRTYDFHYLRGFIEGVFGWVI